MAFFKTGRLAGMPNFICITAISSRSCLTGDTILAMYYLFTSTPDKYKSIKDLQHLNMYNDHPFINKYLTYTFREHYIKYIAAGLYIVSTIFCFF